MRNIATAVLAILLVTPVAAETYKGIGPLDTLADVKQRFPNATFERLQPAWAQEGDVMYAITGTGLSGRIIVKFLDSRPTWRHEAELEEDEEQRKLLTELANASDDSIDVQWVRWIPEQLLPLRRFVAKYGAPEERGFDDDDLQPFRAWTTRGLIAFLSDDEKFVGRVDYQYTLDDRCRAWISKYGNLPEHMKKPCSTKPAAKPDTSKRDKN